MSSTTYRYFGPSLSTESVLGRDSRTLKEKMDEISSFRSRDSEGRLKLTETCKIIFDRVRELPSYKGKIYVLNINDEENPKLEIVEENDSLPKHYVTRQQITDRTYQKQRGNGWKGKFSYGVNAK